MAIISVIVPVYKVEAYIHRCIDSILNQTYQDFELILVDDGSPDNCGRICDDYAQKDSRICVIHQKNGGLSAARNAGLDWVFTNSDSQWLTFVDSDDWIHCRYLEVMMDTAQKNGVSIAACQYVKRKAYCKDELQDGWNTVCVSSQAAYAHYYYQCMTAWCKIYKVSLWESIRFPVGKLHEDAYITHNLIFAVDTVAILDAELYYYYYNPDSITRVKWSEKRLDELEGHEIRLKFCAEHANQACYISEIEAYVDVLVKQTTLLSKCARQQTEFYPHLRRMRKKLREMLRCARSYDRCLFTEEYWGVYTLAYPMKLQRMLIWLLLKVKNNN